MAKTYGNPHSVPPVQCVANIPTWTDSSPTANSTKVRKIHIDELRTKVNTELTRRGITNLTFTDPTITVDVTAIRKIHLDELRTALSASIKKGDCAADASYCPQDTSGAMTFTDSTITVNTTAIRMAHVTELRTKLQALMTSCICEAEQCSYCADCGYAFLSCAYGCACQDHKYNECAYPLHTQYYCASVNLSAGTTYPYKSYPGSCTVDSFPYKNSGCSFGPGVSGDNTVPWVMCNYAPPGSLWSTCGNAGAPAHSTWNCKCNPFTYSQVYYCVYNGAPMYGQQCQYS
jgi:hypothetical protein